MSHPAVLYVEDDPNDVLFMRHAWTKAGVLNPLQVVTDGEAALHYLGGVGSYADRVAHPMPCLTLIDLKLPKVSGFDLVKWIRAEAVIQTLRLIVLSSSAQAADVHTAHMLHANAYLAKPRTFGGWGELVVSVKEFWLTRAETPPECALFSNPKP